MTNEKNVVGVANDVNRSYVSFTDFPVISGAFQFIQSGDYLIIRVLCNLSAAFLINCRFEREVMALSYFFSLDSALIILNALGAMVIFYILFYSVRFQKYYAKQESGLLRTSR